jgi:polysaccharide pyruvyl transferase WcaK-like protein
MYLYFLETHRTLLNFPDERRSQVLLLIASDNHSDDEVLSQDGGDSTVTLGLYTSLQVTVIVTVRYHILIIAVILTVTFYHSFEAKESCLQYTSSVRANSGTTITEEVM